MTRKTRSLVLVVLLVVSVLAPFAAPAAASTAAPSGMTTVPDSNITTDVPDGESVPLDASDLHGRILADQYASSLEVVITTPEHADEVMQSGDANVIGSGDVAVVVRDSEHHSGRDIAVDASILKQTLGYSPTMLYGTHSSGETWRSPATYTDGYLQFHIERFSSNAVTFSGSVSVTGTYGPDSSVQYNLSELDSASDPVVNLTGALNAENETVSGSGSSSISIGGNVKPVAQSGSGDPTLTLESAGNALLSKTPNTQSDSVFVAHSLSSGSEMTDVSVELENRADQSETATIYYSYDDTGGDADDIKLGEKTVGSFYIETFTSSFNPDDTDLSNGGIYVSSTTTDMKVRDTQIGGTDPEFTTSINGQTFNVNAPAGSPVTKSVDLPAGTSELSITGASAGASWSLAHRERTQTSDASVGLNTEDGGAWANQTGVLSDGETASLSINKSALQTGTNTLEVGVGDGSLSADAPTPKVKLNYTHDAAAEKSVDYAAEQWSERYNVSHTYASDREDASLTVPFASDVTEIREVEKRVGGNSWETVPTSSYTLDDTTMTVDLGSVPENTTVDVRAVGGTVEAVNMSINVLEPTAPGDRLNSRIEVTSASSNARINTGSERVTYAYNESWSGADDSALFAAGDQTLRLDGAATGSTFRASTIPVEVNPVSGDVAVSVEDAKTIEPTFVVEPGSVTGDEVDYTYLNAQDEKPYILYSVTDSVVHDSGTASSPITLTDDDSPETLQFQLDDDGTNVSESTDDNTGGPLGPVDVGDAAEGLPVSGTVLIVGVLLVGGVSLFVVRRRYGATPTGTSAGGAASTAGSAASGVLGIVTSAFAWLGYFIRGTASYFTSHPYVAAGVGAVGVIGMFATGVFSIDTEIQQYLTILGSLLAVYMLLTRTGTFTLGRFGVFAGVAIVLALEFINPGSISSALGAGISDAFVVIIMAALALYWLYSRRQKAKAEASTPDIKFINRGDEK